MWPLCGPATELGGHRPRLPRVQVHRVRGAVEQSPGGDRDLELLAVEAHDGTAVAVHAVGRDGPQLRGDRLPALGGGSRRVVGRVVAEQDDRRDGGHDEREAAGQEPAMAADPAAARTGAPPPGAASSAAAAPAASAARAIRRGVGRLAAAPGLGDRGPGGRPRAARGRRLGREPALGLVDGLAGRRERRGIREDRSLTERLAAGGELRGARSELGPGDRRVLERGRGLQRAGHLARGGVAILGLLGRRSRDDLVEGADELGALRARQRRRVGDVRPELRHVAVLGVRDLAGQHLVQHAAERVHVGAAVDVTALDLLGRDVVRRADPRPRARQVAAGARAAS